MGTIATTNPSTGKRERVFSAIDDAELERKLALAARTFSTYRLTDVAERSKWLVKAAERLEARADELARLMTLEMGKLIKAGRDEVKKCAWNCRYYAEEGPRFIADEIVNFPKLAGAGIGAQPQAPLKARVRFDSIGPVLAVMPWNFPFWQVFRFAAPALLAGNVGLLKHASNVPQCALAIESIFKEAGFPEGCFQTLLIGSDKIERIVADDRVQAVTLTGSVEAGQSVAAIAGKNLKKMVLELGGSDPFIVMPSADLDHTVQMAVQGRTVNAGQSCVAAKRFLVHESIADEFEKKFVKAMSELKVGDPLDEKTELGPLSSESILKTLDDQVSRARDLGAKVLTGGGRLDRPGYFYAPTILTGIAKNSPAYSEELFGPVAALFRVRDREHAIAIANDTEFGLGSSIWTNDEAEKEYFARELRAGNVFVNQNTASDPRLPFGGVKKSGYGRELGAFGIREFVNIKTVSG